MATSDDKLEAVIIVHPVVTQHCTRPGPAASLYPGGSDGSKLVIKFFTIRQCKLTDPPLICQILTQANNNFDRVVPLGVQKV